MVTIGGVDVVVTVLLVVVAEVGTFRRQLPLKQTSAGSVHVVVQARKLDPFKYTYCEHRFFTSSFIDMFLNFEK